ncbi:Zinc Finger Protein 69 B [Manis pentadactyla]|nr:Zinc Finger Protein 69 B [Manis pentadactyla]
MKRDFLPLKKLVIQRKIKNKIDSMSLPGTLFCESQRAQEERLTMASMHCAAEAQELLTFEELWLRYSKEEWGCLDSPEGPLQGCYVGELQKSDFLG